MKADFNLLESSRFYRSQKICEVAQELRRQGASGGIHDRSGVDSTSVIDRYAKPSLAIVVHLLQLRIDCRCLGVVVVYNSVRLPIAARRQVVPGIIRAAQTCCGRRRGILLSGGPAALGTAGLASAPDYGQNWNQ